MQNKNMENNHEAVDGILKNVKRNRSTISRANGTQEIVDGYEVNILIPEWEQNGKLIKEAQEALNAKAVFIEEAKRNDLGVNLVKDKMDQIDKSFEKILWEVCRRIRRQRRRNNQNLDEVKKVFTNISKDMRKSIQYHEYKTNNNSERSMKIDALKMNIVRIGEYVSQLENTQKDFWKDFGAENFYDMKKIRNKLAHAEELREGEIKCLVAEEFPIFIEIIDRTYFALNDKEGFSIPTDLLRSLPVSQSGEQASAEKSLGCIRLGPDGNFIFFRMGRSKNNELLISSSKTGPLNLTVYRI